MGLPDVAVLALEVGPEHLAYASVGGVLLLLARLTLRVLGRNDVETVRLTVQLRYERDRATSLAAWERTRADHWYAVALGAPDPPPLPGIWVEPPMPAELAPVAPPNL